jgi:Spy/CpxP family protein refolding chaperone
VNRTVALIAVFALFVIGVGVGALATHIFYSKELDRHGGRPELGAHRFIDRLEHALDLTEEQKRRIYEIVEQSRVEGDALHAEMLPRVREHMRQTEEQIREVLTAEQQVKFDELHRRNRHRAEQLFLGRGRHSHSGGPPRRRPPRDRQPPPPPGD